MLASTLNTTNSDIQNMKSEDMGEKEVSKIKNYMK